MCPPTLLLLNKDHKTTPILGSRNPGKPVQNLYSRWPDYGNGSFTWGDKLKYAVYNNAGSCRRHISASYFTNCFSTHWRPHPSFLRLARAPLLLRREAAEGTGKWERSTNPAKRKGQDESRAHIHCYVPLRPLELPRLEGWNPSAKSLADHGAEAAWKGPLTRTRGFPLVSRLPHCPPDWKTWLRTSPPWASFLPVEKEFFPSHYPEGKGNAKRPAAIRYWRFSQAVRWTPSQGWAARRKVFCLAARTWSAYHFRPFLHKMVASRAIGSLSRFTASRTLRCPGEPGQNSWGDWGGLGSASSTRCRFPVPARGPSPGSERGGILPCDRFPVSLWRDCHFHSHDSDFYSNSGSVVWVLSTSLALCAGRSPLLTSGLTRPS